MTVTFSGSGTIDDPIQISGVKTNLQAVTAEYQYLRERFGVRGQDWRLMHQVLLETPAGRLCDMLAIELANGEKVQVYFDITAYLGKW